MADKMREKFDSISTTVASSKKSTQTISMEKWVVRCTFCLMHWDCEDAFIAKRVIEKHNNGDCGAFWMWKGPAIRAYRVIPGDDNYFPYGASTEYYDIDKTKKYLGGT